MSITYNNQMMDLPSEQLYRLFVSAGWTDSSKTSSDMLKNFNKPFLNSTLVVSAWDETCLVGAVRVLSDKIIRSVIYDLVVLPAYQNRGIGRELVRRCMDHFPNSEWLVETTENITGYYEKMGFKVNNDVFLSIPSIYQ